MDLVFVDQLGLQLFQQMLVQIEQSYSIKYVFGCQLDFEWVGIIYDYMFFLMLWQNINFQKCEYCFGKEE